MTASLDLSDLSQINMCGTRWQLLPLWHPLACQVLALIAFSASHQYFTAPAGSHWYLRSIRSGDYQHGPLTTACVEAVDSCWLSGLPSSGSDCFQRSFQRSTLPNLYWLTLTLIKHQKR